MMMLGGAPEADDGAPPTAKKRLAALREQAARMEALAASLGWQYVRHSTGSDIALGAAGLKQAFETFGARL